MLHTPIEQISGVGPKRAALFHKLGITDLMSLITFAPRDYEDFSTAVPVANVQHGLTCAVQVCIASEARLFRPKGNLDMVSVTAQDATGKLQLVWFHQPYRKNQLPVGKTVYACGRVDGKKMVNARMFESLPGIVPVYPLVQGLSQRNVIDAVKAALKLVDSHLKETLPTWLRIEYALCERNFALHNLHFPMDQEALARAKRRLAFEDMLCYMLAVAMLRESREKGGGIAFDTRGAKEALQAKLPFPLTRAQLRAMDEIARDMRASSPMNRLLQGDVGSGKTLVACYALCVCMQSGYQGVFMAPTEILARQHYATLCRIVPESDVCLITGNMKKRARDDAYARVKSGQARLIVGTHALLQEGLTLENMGLVVTDEQHRFGVRQRAQILKKSDATPDVLVMSATPIPRTLSLLLYGDLDVSVIDELPPGRKSVRTRIVPKGRRKDLYDYVCREAQAGLQTYVVCPLVEASDNLDVLSAQQVHRELVCAYPTLRIGLLHGRMANVKKEEVLAQFRAHALDVLVSTTVVEVGVDVPNASIMVIENADRFGLAQLHQLRGRVGRGATQSYCFVLTNSDADSVHERLETLVRTQDGFQIAQKDLELRGPGEFLGTRQHGVDQLASLRLASNLEVLQDAKRAAQAVLARGRDEQTEALFARARALYDTKQIAHN